MTITFTATSPKTEQSISESIEFYNDFARRDNYNIKIAINDKSVHVDGFVTGETLIVNNVFQDVSDSMPNCKVLIVRDNIGSYKTK
jgi:hypothetical protein